MKVLSKLAIINLFCFATLPAAADDVSNQYAQQASTNMENLVQYLTNLGGYFGYDITQPATVPPQSPSQSLLNSSLIQLTENYVFNTFLGAIPVDYITSALAMFVPNNAPGASIINNFANATFNYQNYSSPSTGQSGNVSASSLLDQSDSNGKYLGDPVSQAVFNILGTPDYTYCMNNDSSAWISNCNLKYQDLIMGNIIGTYPNSQQFFTYSYNQPLISQLNSNSLLGPLLYTTNSQSSDTSSPLPNSGNNQGLTAQNQAQQAANFIRYAAGAATPVQLPKSQQYDQLFNQAFPPKNANVNVLQQEQAKSTLSIYLNSLRTFAAQSSVGISNLYYILSKRLPQNQGGTNQILTSQAMSEFNMATWRLFSPSKGDNQAQSKQWVEQLDTASSATVQKEIAVLLAEINYQMYLDRQIQERLLLTNSIMLMQSLNAHQPVSDFSDQEGAPQ